MIAHYHKCAQLDTILIYQKTEAFGDDVFILVIFKQRFPVLDGGSKKLRPDDWVIHLR